MNFYKTKITSFKMIDALIKTGVCNRTVIHMEIMKKFGFSENMVDKYIDKNIECGIVKEEAGILMNLKEEEFKKKYGNGTN